MSEAWEWVFKSFVTSRNQSVVEDWYGSQVPDVRAAFDISLRYLSKQPPSNWVRPYVGTLKRQCAGLWEIRFTVEKVRYRPIGFFGPVRMEFTIVAFATEKGGSFVPAGICESALKRKEEVISDPGRAVKYDPNDRRK